MLGRRLVAAILFAAALLVPLQPSHAQAPGAAAIVSPEQSLGFPIGADNRLVRWDTIVDYMRHVAAGTPRVQVRELGRTTQGNPFIAVEISAPDTMARLGRFKQLQRKLYFQGGPPSAAERDEIFASGKAVVVVTCNLHSTEIGASQMAVDLGVPAGDRELAHREKDPRQRHPGARAEREP